MKNLTTKIHRSIIFILTLAAALMLVVCNTTTANAAEAAKDYAVDEVAENLTTNETAEDSLTDGAEVALTEDDDEGWATITVDYVEASTGRYLLSSLVQRVRIGNIFESISPSIYGYVPEQTSILLDEVLGSQHLTVKYNTVEEQAEKDLRSITGKQHDRDAGMIYVFYMVSLLALILCSVATVKEKTAIKNSEDDWTTSRTTKKRHDVWLD